MPGTKAGGLKAARTNKERYGDDFYAKMGRRGGKNGHSGGFASNPALARLAGAKGGRVSKRGKSVHNIPNIEKPAVDKSTESFLKIMLEAVFKGSISAGCLHAKKGAGISVERIVNETIEAQKDLIDAGRWEEALILSFLNEGYEEAFREGLHCLINGDIIEDRETRATRLILISQNRLEIATISRCYEYITGKNPVNGKKIHKGVYDGEA